MVKTQHMHKYVDEEVIQAKFLGIMDDVIPQLKGWSIARANENYLLRQYCCSTTEPRVVARINIWTTGTVLLTCSPRISSGEFKRIVDLWTKLVDVVKKGLQNDLSPKELLPYIV